MIFTLLDHLPLGWILKFALLRLASQWRSLLTIIAGVALAACIGAAVPLYTSAVSQAGMIERLERQPAQSIHVYSRISVQPPGPDFGNTWAAFDAEVQQRADGMLRGVAPGWVEAVVGAAETIPMQAQRGDEVLAGLRFRAAYYEGWREFAALVEGDWPAASPDGANFDLEAAVGLEAASAAGVNVGDVLALEESGRASSRTIRVRIAGIIGEADPDSAYWAVASPLRVDRTSGQADFNLFVEREALVSILTDYVPETSARIIWRVLFDYSRLPFDRVQAARVQLARYRESIRQLFDGGQFSLVFETSVIPALGEYQEEVRRLAGPFGLILLQIGGLVLLFLMVIAALVRRSERREIALLQSRGSLDAQIMVVRGAEAAIICLLAALAAPTLTRQALVWLVPVVMNIERLPLEVRASAYVYAGLAAITALFVLVSTLRPVLKLPLIFGGGTALRSETQAWWQRYYLDVVLMMIGLAGLWRLLNANSTLVATRAGESRADPLLLLAPALLFIALGSVLLRFFPVAMRALARALTALRGLAGALAGWQVSREPMHYARITFLLALAVGTGWFATSFRATVIRSQSDQAHYQTGADVRIAEIEPAGGRPHTRPLEDYLAIPGVESASPVLRYSDVSVAVNTIALGGGDVLAVDYATLRDTAYWRSDLGAFRPPYEGEAPPPPPASGDLLPFRPQRIGMWVKLIALDPNFSPENQNAAGSIQLRNADNGLAVRLRDSDGFPHYVPLEVAEVEGAAELAAELEGAAGDEPVDLTGLYGQLSGWVYLEGDLTGSEIPPGDLRLDGILYFNLTGAFSLTNWILYVTELTLIDEVGQPAVLDWLAHDEWEYYVDDLVRVSIGQFELIEMPERSGAMGYQIQWSQPEPVGYVGLTLHEAGAPVVPALVSPSFLELNNLRPGLNFTLNLNRQNITFVIVGVMNYFPTLYGDQRPFVVADLSTLLYAFSLQTGETAYPSEVWLDLAPGVSPAEVIQALSVQESATQIAGVETFEAALSGFETDPLSLGLIGLLYLSFIVVLALSIISLLTYSALTAQQRRPELGVLQALGVSTGRLVASMALEQALVTGIAAVLGAVLGVLLSSRVLPTLAGNTTTQTATPPFLIQVESAALMQYGVFMAFVLALVLGFSLVLVRRLSLSRALRMGEE